MDVSRQILSDITVHMKYARYLPELGRRESFEEIVTRNMEMHIRKYPHIEEQIRDVYERFVYTRKVLPSMRSLQFGGKPIELSNSRMFNCAYLPLDSISAFSEVMFLLLGGTGVGYSVQKRHVSKLPEIHKPTGRKRRFLVADNIEGWADAIKVLMKSYTKKYNSIIDFDFGDIRPKGERLITSGGKAPGPQPLKDAVHKIKSILDSKEDGSKLTPIECHDICCHIADCVLSGGIRRAAMISLFSHDDADMAACKSGSWWELNPQRGRANNSAILHRQETDKYDFLRVWDILQNSGSGEPGFFFVNDWETGTNPCIPEWAKLLTPSGIRELKDIEIGDTVWSGSRWTKVINKWSTGIKDVHSYETPAGTFYGTENHKVLRDGVRVEAKDADAIDACLGEVPTSIDIDWQDVMDGLVIGDGTVHKASNNKVLLLIGKKDGDYHNKPVKDYILKERLGISPYSYEIQTTVSYTELPKTFERQVPDRFYYGDNNKKVGFLKGLFSANGCVTNNRVQYKTSSKRLAQQVQEMLSSLGMRSSLVVNAPYNVQHKNGFYTSKESYNIILYNSSVEFMNLIGFLQDYKMQSPVKNSSARNSYSDVRSTSYVSTEEVFDITVEAEEHTFWCNGMLVSNCGEIALLNNQMCNLTEIGVSDVYDQEEFNQRCYAAAFIGTLQAGYTNFHYLRPIWQENCEKEALLGVSMTGIASEEFLKLDLKQGAEIAKNTNIWLSEMIGINPSARVTTVKPAGTTSLVLGSSSGIHAWHDEYYIRRIRVGKDEAIYSYLSIYHPELIEDEFFNPEKQAVISVPQKAPDGAITRYEGASSLLDRIKRVYNDWVKEGHNSGVNTHNVSATVSVKDDEWEMVRDWMWENRENYNGISILPYDGGTYIQAPFETTTKERYEEMFEKLSGVDLSKVVELDDNTSLTDQAACAGGNCEIK